MEQQIVGIWVRASEKPAPEREWLSVRYNKNRFKGAAYFNGLFFIEGTDKINYDDVEWLDEQTGVFITTERHEELLKYEQSFYETPFLDFT